VRIAAAGDAPAGHLRTREERGVESGLKTPRLKRQKPCGREDAHLDALQWPATQPGPSAS